MFYDQSPAQIRFEWGANGITRLMPVTDVFIIVDVLSFSTCVDVAVARGAHVYSYQWLDQGSHELAEKIGGIVAVSPGEAKTGDYALSPASLMTIPAKTRLILPSPNGSTLSTLTGDIPTFAGCLRNAAAVASAAEQVGERITLIAAGERWKHDRTLRPALEDLAGCGAIIHHLHGTRSPEAEMAAAAFLSMEAKLPSTLAACSSGKELIEKGRPDDVALAAELNVSAAAPRLIDGAYQWEETS